MKTFSFENLHKNHKLAYLDGLLCGVVITVMGVKIYNEYREAKEFERLVAEDEKARAAKKESTK